MSNAELGEFHYKANLFKVLSELYKEPGADLPGYMDYLIEALEELQPALALKAEDLADELDKYQLSHNENKLVIDYAKLFVGPFDMKAPPYGSVYLDDGRRLMGDSTTAVEKFYSETGVEKLNVYHQPADHISVELEFMYYLYFKYVESGELKYLDRMQRFMQQFLFTWIFKFAKKIRENANEPFYLKLAQLTEEIIEWEAHQLEIQV
ncbi:TorD/DmsD family molecular chaperone [Salisediminibacterium selenitireducens]|uniref:Cytoplasmic chaperone TorD family protein n=1 Tax=Bacillus selenitireducens (strain ATCC 700615 / DSM 15326 / MLS10) TaxID=439292 RepID=D6XXR2_BACIE|nr:molecular chaperone TorD family protein [Salisediminibacterium selenitireducens]ADI00105.1 cytoplasmic chaperone TorD family protein [[Bacillus] selenitireducens MLS10]